MGDLNNPMLSWLKKHQHLMLLAPLFAFIAIALFDRGGIHYPSVLLLSVFVLPFSVIAFLKKKERSSGLTPALMGIMWLFLASFIASYLFAETRTFGLTSLVVYTAGPLLMMILSSLSLSKEQEQRFLKALALLGGVAALVGLMVFFTEPFNRLAAPFRNAAEAFSFFPNAMADFLLLMIPIGGWAAWSSKGKQRIFFAGLSLVMLTAFFLTFSRGAYIALGGGWLVFALLQFFKQRSKALPGIFTAGLAIVIAFGVSWGAGEYRSHLFEDSTINATTASEKITLESNEGTSSISERIDFWQGSLLLIPLRPWFGAGPESFRNLYPQVQAELLAFSDHPHNVLLKLAVEHGLIATILLALFLLGYLVVFVMKSRSQGEDLSLQQALLLSGCLALFAHNLIDYNLQFTSISVLFWVLLGLVASHWRSSGRQSQLFAIPVFILTIPLFFLGLWEGLNTIEFRRGTADMKAEQYQEAIDHFENAEGIVFPRNLFIDTAIASSELYEQTGEEHWKEESKSALEQHLALNPHDAFAWHFLAQYASEDNGDRERFLMNALALDSMNHLQYHLSLFDYWEESPIIIAPEDHVVALHQLIDDYLAKLKVNAHLTILTDNPETAVELCESLEEHFAQEDERCDELEETYTIEVEKFEAAYGEIDEMF